MELFLTGLIILIVFLLMILIDIISNIKESANKLENELMQILLLNIAREKEIFEGVKNHVFNNDEH